LFIDLLVFFEHQYGVERVNNRELVVTNKDFVVDIWFMGKLC